VVQKADEVHVLAIDQEGRLTDLWDLPTDPETHGRLFDGHRQSALTPVECPSRSSCFLHGAGARVWGGDPEGRAMNTPSIVSREKWNAAREKLLVKEKKVTRAHDALAAARRRMPWMAVDKEYRFEGPSGPMSLADLFEGRRQLIVYRAFYGPEITTYAEGGSYPERACVGCSLGADQVAHPGHLHARNTSLAWASRAPQADIQDLKKRHGWEHIPWYTITDDFDKDFDVDEWHGTNAFIREGDAIFRTYFINVRGDEQMGGTWNYLDITALGRQENWEDSPEGYPQTAPYQWWNYHDAYKL
jgi:predicted dithiol-disulfide oxidoreductase (DUF899 family)